MELGKDKKGEQGIEKRDRERGEKGKKQSTL